MRSLGTLGSALVPTMGAFHKGHLELIRAARATGRPVVVSIFVNPTQFGPHEDYSRYPRDLDRDAELAEQAGVEVIFHPEAREMYPRPSSSIHVAEVTEHFEGSLRPGHFDGVSTVVCKLFQIVRPDVALFGLKDLQQCVVIRRMVDDLNIPVELRFQPTVREADGLAMSSRNAYLSSEERAAAPLIYRLLTDSRTRLLDSEEPDRVLKSAWNRLTEGGFEPQYFELVDLESFTPVRRAGDSTALVAAARIGKTRLIDNVLLFDRPNMP